MDTNSTSISLTFPTDRTNHKKRTATEQRHKQRQQKNATAKNQKNHQRQKQQRQQQHQQEFDNLITSITLS